MEYTRQVDLKPDPAAPLNFELGFMDQLRMMGNAFWISPVRNRLLALIFALLFIILVTAYGQVRLNEWYAPFYNSLERRDMDGFIHQLKIFTIIAGTLLLLNVFQTWLNQMTALYMREGLSKDMVNQWLKPGRAAKLAGFGSIAVNPDQRLHEDSRNLAESSTSLAIGLVNSTILLVSFIGVLWGLSSGFYLTIGGSQVAIPGYMVWAAMFYAGSASLLSNLVGHRLVGLNAERYSKEAELRFSLMRANENMTAITLARGERNERARLGVDINSVLSVIRGLAMALTHLTWVSSGYGWLAIVAPILIAAPVYFSGNLTFGGLMMAVGAFNQVNNALRWYIDNFGAIASWKATLLRVSAFRNALLQMDAVEKQGATIDFEVDPAAKSIILSNVMICGEAGAKQVVRGFRLKEEFVELQAGEHLLVNGDQGVNRRLLFAAMGGLWLWGQGRISVPPLEDALLMPQRGYIPVAPLREILSYPHSPAVFNDEECSEVLTLCGLDELVPRLDENARWDKKLDTDAQMCLRVANAILLQPRWLILDDILEGLEPDTQNLLADALLTLKDSAVIYFGRSETFLNKFAPTVVHLEALPTNGNGH
ncbi:putative ATP-binding cassette transporter [Rhizobium sp. BIGb0125]|uniref:ABC transporter ATP-binding protein/permease n=1 Tax=Rhizobium sp. BIGb0125 TaxID=2940618 RepID=UPI00216A86DC|nr:ABC transporter ATP-binding protein/permease [Rhizobium sp. BIGb0125]MCS4240687.1 putative ATP-binding cassette transporter [Rhizobium sp. BIGb0125]